MQKNVHVIFIVLLVGCSADLPVPPAYPDGSKPSNVTLGRTFCGRVFHAAEEKRGNHVNGAAALFTIGSLLVVGAVPPIVYAASEAEQDDASVAEVSLPFLLGIPGIALLGLGGWQISEAGGAASMRDNAAVGATAPSDRTAFNACVKSIAPDATWPTEATGGVPGADNESSTDTSGDSVMPGSSATPVPLAPAEPETTPTPAPQATPQ
jgi:hypothetical protein